MYTAYEIDPYVLSKNNIKRFYGAVYGTSFRDFVQKVLNILSLTTT